MKIKEWSNDEAEKEFEKIEKIKGNNESYDIEFKEALCWENTSVKTNTTQRAFSGLANTYGGYLVVGFTSKGELKGVEEKPDIENHIMEKLGSKLQPKKRDYISSLFKVKYYEYKGKMVLVIFIKASLIPLQCDNGVYYYREQSQFKFMPHFMLEDKFRKSFEEEKNVYLVMDELEHFKNGYKTFNNLRGDFRIDFFFKNLIESQKSLYYFYKRHNLLVSVGAIVKPLRFLVSTNTQFNSGSTGIIEGVENLLKSLKRINEREVGDEQAI